MSTARMTGLADIVFEIESGRYDGDLKEIEEAVNGRRNEMLGAWRSAMKPGFRVKVSSNCHPKYMRGAVGRVDHREGRRWTIHLDTPINSGRSYRNVSIIRATPDVLEPEE